MSDEPTFQAGAAMSNITPPIGSDQARGARKQQATHVHDELHARCLVLDDGQSKLALVVCDLRHISAEVVAGAKQIIERSTGIPPQCVLVSATHTHTSTGAKRQDAYASPQMPPTIDVVVQTHRIGDLAIAAMPFEVFAEIGLELKQHSPIQPLMNISIANGSHGYLPTPC